MIKSCKALLSADRGKLKIREPSEDGFLQLEPVELKCESHGLRKTKKLINRSQKGSN